MKSATALSLLALLVAPAANGETPVDETRPIAPDAVIEVENVAGSVRVRVAQTDQVKITGTLGDGVEQLQVEGDRDRLRIEVEHESDGGFGGWWGGGRVGDSDLEIELPAGVTLTVETVSASIDVEGLAGMRVELESVSGDIGLRSSAEVVSLATVSGEVSAAVDGSREVSLESVSGAIGLSGAVSGRVEAESVSGSIRLAPEGALPKLQASGVSGNIDIRMTLASGGRLSAETLSGSLTVTLPKSTSATVRGSSFSGSITSDAGTVEQEEFGPGSSLGTTLGEGDGTIELESFSGRLKLNLE